MFACILYHFLGRLAAVDFLLVLLLYASKLLSAGCIDLLLLGLEEFSTRYKL